MTLFSVGQVWAAPDESVTFSAQGYSNQQAVSSYNGTDFSIAFDQGTNSNNAPKYYTSGSAIRAYGGNTMTISSSTKTIKEIVITFGSSDGSNAITTNVATYSNGTWTGSASSVTFTIGGSSGNRRLSAIAITYATGGTTTPSLSVAPTSIDFGTVEQGASVSSEVVAVTFANLTGSVTYSGLSGAFSATGNIAATGDEITIAANTSTIGEYEQTLTVNSAADALSKTVTVSMNVVAPFNGLQLTFPDYNDNNVASYTATWTATKGGQVWTIANFNNNNSGWNLIKAGRNNNNASVATITTQVANPVESVVVTVSSVVAANVNSHKLYVADNADFTDAIEIDGDPATIVAGDITYTIPADNRAEDLYYKLEYDLAAGSGNGFLQISKLAYAYGTAAPQKQPTGLAYATANYLVKVGASLAPELTNPNSLTGITYASSDADVVAVDENTGALTIKAAGKAVITASRAADDIYKAGSASYTVYVATEAGTAEDPLSEASAKALIDLGCEMEAHVHGTVLGSQDATKFTVTLAGGMQFYKLKDLGNVAFESAYIGNGDEVTAVGQLSKYNNTTYQLAAGCYLTAYTEYTEPLVDISNTKATAYTVAQALALAANPTSDLTKAVYIAGVVYDVKSFNSTNGTLNIYIKDAGVDNKFEFYKCAGIYDESLTAFTAEDDVQVGDEVIGYGVMKYYPTDDIWEFDNAKAGDYLVELVRPDVAVESVSLTESTAEVEVGSTVTLHASVLPENATNKGINWSVQSGSDYASVADGVVTGVAVGEAVIRAASTADPTKYSECTVTVTAADPSKHVVTFDATVDQGESPLSKSNISMACSSGVLNNGSEYRLYKNSTTTFECSVGNITKIEFTGVSGNPVSGFGDPEVGSLVTEGNDGVWTGNAASVTFTASGAQVRATEIKVTYKEDTRAAAGLEWSTDAVVLTVGDAFVAPTLTNPNSIAASAITIASDNTDLAVVNDGVVSLVANATGEATITATFAGNDDYKPATISYTITVNAVTPAPAGTIYRKVTATEDITDGEYLIVYEDENVAFNGNLTTLDADHNTVDVVISEGVIAGSAEIDAAVFTIDVANGTLRAHMGDYIGVTSYGNGLKQNANAETYPAHSFSIDGEGNAVISLNNSWTAAMILNYNKGASDKRFRYYKSASPQQPIQLYKKEATEPQYETIRSGLEPGRHYTVCLEKNVTAVKGATFWSLTYKNNENTAAYLVEETEIEAGKPYIYQATADKLEVLYGTETATNPVENGALRGTFSYLDADALNTINNEGDNEVYMLFNNELRPIGMNNHLDDHRAYVLYNLLQPVSSTSNLAPGKKVKAMPLHKETATDIDNLNASEKPVKMVIDGQLYIIRGEKMYDATGRLVK